MRILVPILLCAVLLSGCRRVVTDCSDELTMHLWQGEYDNGMSVSLSFDDDDATLSLSLSDGRENRINGLCVLDLEQFVIIDDDTSESFSFGYTVHGDSVDITYDDASLSLKKVK